MTVQTAEAPAIPCACCGETLDAVYQPSLYAEMQSYWLITCRNPDCGKPDGDGLYQYTFSSNNYPPEDWQRIYLAGPQPPLPVEI